MNLVKEVLHPNNAIRPFRPTDADGLRFQAELEAYKFAGLLPSEIEANYATGKLLHGPAWKDPNNWWWTNGPRKVWKAGTSVGAIVFAQHPDGSYKTAEFTAGTSFDFRLWHRAQADFANGAYGRFFDRLPILRVDFYNQEEAGSTNFGPGPTAAYPIQMGPTMFPRIDIDGNIKWFNMKEFRDVNPIVGETSHIIPVGAVGVPDEMLLEEIGKIARSPSGAVRQRLDMIRQMLGVPIPVGNQQTPSI